MTLRHSVQSSWVQGFPNSDMHNSHFSNISSDWQTLRLFFFTSTEGWFVVCLFVYKSLIYKHNFGTTNKTIYYKQESDLQTQILNYKQIIIQKSDFKQNFWTTNTSLYRSLNYKHNFWTTNKTIYKSLIYKQNLWTTTHHYTEVWFQTKLVNYNT